MAFLKLYDGLFGPNYIATFVVLMPETPIEEMVSQTVPVVPTLLFIQPLF